MQSKYKLCPCSRGVASHFLMVGQRFKTQWKLFCHYGNQFFYTNGEIFEKITQKMELNLAKHTQVIKVMFSLNNLDSKIQVILGKVF